MASTLDGGEDGSGDQNINQYHTSVHQLSHNHTIGSPIIPLLQSRSDLLLQYKHSPHGPS